MKYLGLLTLSLLSAYILIGCGKNSKDNSMSSSCDGVFTSSGYCVPNGVIVATNQWGQCPAGYINNTPTTCIPSNYSSLPGVTPGIGFYAENACGYTQSTVVGGAIYKEFLKNAMGTCDRTSNSGGYMGCDAYLSGLHDVVIQMPTPGSTQVQVTIRAGTRANTFAGGYGSYNYGYQLPSSWGEFLLGIPSSNTYYGATMNPLQLTNMVVSNINNNNGFEIRGYGAYYTAANRSLIQLQVNEGRLDGPGFNYTLLYKGQPMIQGNMLRCQTPDCGLSKYLGQCY